MATHAELESVAPASQPRKPITSRPGSPERIEELRRRAELRQRLFADGDVHDYDSQHLTYDVAGNHAYVTSGTAKDAQIEKQLLLTAVSKDTFSERLLFLRKRRRKTLRQIATATGLTNPCVSLLERGIRRPTLLTVILLAEALEVPVGILAGDAKAVPRG